jgi:hypothetical protein
LPEPTDRPRHRGLGGLLSLVALAAAGVGSLAWFDPDRLADWLGRDSGERTLWLVSALLGLAAVALVVGLILLCQPRGSRRPNRAPTVGPVDDGPSQPPPAPPPADHWPPDQAIGRGWARAVDLVGPDDSATGAGPG